jgi:hypothetical protein
MPVIVTSAGGAGAGVGVGPGLGVGVGAGDGLGGRTVTVNVADFAFPARSLAVTVTAVVPTGNVEPLGGVEVTVGFGSTRSVAVALM